MTQQEYQEILKEKWSKVNVENLQEIKEYNRYKKQLRKELNDSD